MLTAHDTHLLSCAIKARNNAQAPYSNYKVGAAVTSARGNIYGGCNVERASYSQTTHAEQNAIDTMITAEGSVKIEQIIIVAAPATVPLELTDIQENAIKPFANGGSCGHCLQIIWENCYSDKQVPIYFVNQDLTIMATTIGSLLPFPFGPSDLGIFYK